MIKTVQQNKKKRIFDIVACKLASVLSRTSSTARSQTRRQAIITTEQDAGFLNIQSGEFDEINGVYKGVATFSDGSNAVHFDVSCKAVNGQPSNQWETKAYSANKQAE